MLNDLSMYLKYTKNSSGQAYYHLVESYRENGRTRQRTLLSLGRVEGGKLENLAQAIAKYSDKLNVIALAKDIDVSETFILGPLLILQRLFEKTGIDEVLKALKASHPKMEMDVASIVFSLVAARWIRPCSKLAVYERLLDQLYPELFRKEIELHHLYRVLDLLCEKKEQIEVSLYRHGKDLFNLAIDLVFYDLTTLRFESTRQDLGSLGRFGYSKEMRSDCTQLVLGLLMDGQGVPLGYEVFAGNTFEGNTLPRVLTKLKEKFVIKRVVFVADRGLLSRKNISLLKACGYEFIVGMRLSQLKKQKPQIFDLSQYHWIRDDLAACEIQEAQERLILTWSRKRAERDRKVREDILEKIRKKLSGQATAKKFVTHSAFRRYLKGLDEGCPQIDEHVIIQEAKEDGFFGILTNTKQMSAKEIIMSYKELWRIEDAFGEIKGTLQARPLFHWTDRRIIGHLMICFLAYFCEAHLIVALRRRKSSTTAAKALEHLTQVKAVPVRVKSQTLWVRTDIHGPSQEAFSALAMKAPPKVLNVDQNPKCAGTLETSARKPA